MICLYTMQAHSQSQNSRPQNSHSQNGRPLQALPLATRDVGDIPFDPALDDTSFHLADSNHVFQYYNTRSWWLENRRTYLDSFLLAVRDQATRPESAKQSGWLTIRFIVNTAGRTGRFRLLEMDSAYQPCHFDPALSNPLLEVTKTIPWEPAKYRNKRWDTYQYITFHLQRGRIIDIMP